MPHSFQVRTGQAGDAVRLAVLAAQVWLHTYATDGISNEIAQYVLSELTVEKFSEHLNEHQTTILVAERDHYLAGFAVLKAPDIPSVLVETAFISNPQEEEKLRSEDYQKQLTEALLRGIQQYFSRNPPLARNRSI